MTLTPAESGKLIASLSKKIMINNDGIKKLGDIIIKSVNDGSLSLKNFSQNEYHPKCTNRIALDWLFVVDTLNFCFWSPGNHKHGWTVDGSTGYFALCAAINRALKENVDITNPNFYATISEDSLRNVLRSDYSSRQVPLIQDRLKSLHQVGKVLLEKFGGTFKNCVLQAENSATKLLDIVVENFECFRDEADYKGYRVSLYKRAQILVGDVWACFQNTGIGYFKDIDQITMFADYRVPQSLLYFKVFIYTPEFLAALKKNNILRNGDEDEVEIRGCSIHAVELVKEYVKSKLEEGKVINAILIDHFLWDFRRAHAKEIYGKGLPFHKALCVYY